jgi:hypothetical protein
VIVWKITQQEGRKQPAVLLARIAPTIKRLGRTPTFVLCSRNRGGMESDDLLCSRNARPQRPSLGAHRKGQSGDPAEERKRKNDRTEYSVNASGGIAQSGKVEWPCSFPHRLSLTGPQHVIRPNCNADQDHMRLVLSTRCGHCDHVYYPQYSRYRYRHCLAGRSLEKAHTESTAVEQVWRSTPKMHLGYVRTRNKVQRIDCPSYLHINNLLPALPLKK